MDSAQIAGFASVVISAVAAWTDHRTGLIPNWLTYPVLLVAPIAWFFTEGLQVAVLSLVGLIVCGMVPFVLFRRGAMGGGDVKIFAACGAVLGWRAGLEVEIWSLIAVVFLAFGKLAWDGLLLRTFGNVFFLVLNPMLPKSKRRPIEPTLMAKARMGVAIFLAALGTFVYREVTMGGLLL